MVNYTTHMSATVSQCETRVRTAVHLSTAGFIDEAERYIGREMSP